jgi:hypothetical protein
MRIATNVTHDNCIRDPETAEYAASLARNCEHRLDLRE